MSVLNKEDSVTTRTASNALGAYLNAMQRDREAVEKHSELFKDPVHEARVNDVCDLLEEFFERNVDYITARGLGNRNNFPFDAIKMESVGAKLSRMAKQHKWDKLYGPLAAIGDLDVVSDNGHLTVRVYGKGKMPKKTSKNSVYRWY
jgi:hypothetical protein